MALEKKRLLTLPLRWELRVFLFYLAPSRLEAGAPRERNAPELQPNRGF